MRTVGVIDYDETALADVTTKFKGWIEKLYVDATGAVGDAGRAAVRDLFARTLQRPEWSTCWRIDSPTNMTPGAAGLRTSALTKLKFFDISDEQIAELERTRQPQQDPAHPGAAGRLRGRESGGGRPDGRRRA